MSRVIAISMMSCLVATATSVAAGIPEPDAILYGAVSINGTGVQQQQEVTLIARLGNGQEVGRFSFNDCNRNGVADTCELNCDAPGCSGVEGCGTGRDTGPKDGLLDDCAGHLYVLRIRSESVPVGLSPSGVAVVLNPADPPTVRVFVKSDSGPEQLAREVVVSERGKIRNVGLLPADLHALQGLVSCLGGPGGVDPPKSCDASQFATFDYDEDGRIDLRDIAFVQRAIGVTHTEK